MKNPKILFIGILALITLQTKAQLSGKIPLLGDTVWTLSSKTGYNLKVKGDKNGHFWVDISKLSAGIYSFGEIDEIFIQPDYKTQIDFIDKKYIFTGSGSIENNILQQMGINLNKFFGNTGYGVSFSALLTEPSIFIPALDDYIKKSNLSAKESSNTFFKDFIKQEAEFDKRYCLYAYNRFYGLDSSKMAALRKILSIPVANRNADYKKELQTAYQAQFSKKLTPEEKQLLNKTIYEDWDLNNEVLYKNSKYYVDMISYRIDYMAYLPEHRKLRDSIQNDDILKLSILNNLISNNRIKEDFAFRYTNGAIKKAKIPTEVKIIYESFINQSKNEKHKLEVKKSYDNLIATLNDKVAPDFNYVNNKGELVSLKSFRGKYVYIDIWATWCAPCIAEIPSLKKIEEQYKDKKIHFVSISVDTKTQKQQWLNFVEKNNLQGTQLMADNDFKSDFIQKFGINAIPRFILIGPDGKIIDNDAKRPSNKELIKQLDSYKL
ncbi:TlpA disulfide reductase family protein [Pedobacter nototheniae]|uniref:TlpA family protein disulfide reductase n=1 Tax=Pedobacter nototheniae TaxID=2488994 RepID=UPI00292DD454|nr:TlpA disulfide reductase family protein [Pedobacter nototheniae]